MDISVIVPTYNRKKSLRKALESLISQDPLGKFTYEVLIIDDGSSDGTEDVVTEIIRRECNVPISYVYKEGGGAAAARNTGVAQAHGQWIAFFDDDQWAEPRWLSELYETALENDAQCVGGTMLLDLPDSWAEDLSPFCRRLLDENVLATEAKKYPADTLPSTGHVLIRRNVIERIGGFELTIREAGEDSDLFARLQRQGVRNWYTPRAIAHHVIPESRLTTEYFRYVSLRAGLAGARIRYKHMGHLRWFLALGRRIFRSFMRDVWLLLIAFILGDKSKQLDRKCRLWCDIGYMRGSLSILAPRQFRQKKFIESLSLRSRLAERSRANGHSEDKM